MDTNNIFNNGSKPSVCSICPRKCNIDRNIQNGYCGVKNEIMVARAALHMWEEPCISGNNGSGTVFFSGCNLRCVYCQNNEISTGKIGKNITINRLSEIFLELQQKGANNINLVTPSHYIFQIIVAIKNAKANGLTIPILYNSSAYESVDTIKALKGHIDIYLPDCKYYDDINAIKYSNAHEYHQISIKAIKEMYEQVGQCEFDSNGIIRKGVIVRHLVLPGCVEDSKKVIESLFSIFENNIFYSIMNQYTPIKQIENFPELNRKLSEKEYDEVLDFAIDIGIENGFMQEGDVASESFIPAFDYEGI